MRSVQEVLRQHGLSDNEIAGLDSRATNVFAEMVNDAEQARETAELALRSNRQFYDETIVPALNGWGNEKTALEAQVAFYKQQNESARNSGFVPTDAPGVEQPRDQLGRYVAAQPGGIPGSPTFMDQVDQRLGTGISNVGWAMQEYQRLSGGQFLPDSFDTLAMEATNNRLPFRDYVARKYDFAGKHAALQKKQQEEHDDKVRRSALEENDRKWSERLGSNPDVRIAQPSRFADVTRAVKNNERPDPLSLDKEQRRRATAAAIRSEIAQRLDESA